ncbi:hypothetical protein GGF43_004859 [Coemansia sp. RSA 2618]|nr:hypothetical protein GGF43_004859 [Coemansia sp. RSA 2618]
MSLQKSFLDMNSLEMPWVGSQISLLPSTGNSQNETLLLIHFMALALHSEDNRRLHQDHKIIKRAVDKNSQEAAASLSSLHEKISKVNLSINDLHSDLKKLERTVTMDNHSPHSSVVNMELKLGSIGKCNPKMYAAA